MNLLKIIQFESKEDALKASKLLRENGIDAKGNRFQPTIRVAYEESQNDFIEAAIKEFKNVKVIQGRNLNIKRPLKFNMMKQLVGLLEWRLKDLDSEIKALEVVRQQQVEELALYEEGLGINLEDFLQEDSEDSQEKPLQ